MSLLDKARAAFTSSLTQADVLADRERTRLARAGAPVALQDLAAEHSVWVDQSFAAARTEDYRTRLSLRDELVATLRAATPSQQQAAVARSAAWLGRDVSGRDAGRAYGSPEAETLSALRARRLPWTADDVSWLLTMAATRAPHLRYLRLTLASVGLTAAAKLPSDQLGVVVESLERLVQVTRKEDGDSQDAGKIVARAQALLDSAQPEGTSEVPTGLLDHRDAFGRPALAELQAAFAPDLVATTLRHLASYGATVTPSKKWSTRTDQLVAERPEQLDVCRTLLRLASTHHEEAVDQRYGTYEFTTLVFASPQTTTLLRAAVWWVASVAEDDDVALLGSVATHCGIGLGGSGGQSRCAGVTSSAVAALTQVSVRRPDLATPVVAALARLRDKVQNKTLRTATDRALLQVAEAVGLSPGQLLERAVPTFGLGPDSTAEVPAGDHTALVSLEHGPAGAKLVTTWRTGSGKPVKTVPAAVRTEHPDVVSQLKSDSAQVKKVAASQRARLEDLLGVERTWLAHEWVEYYPAHAVVGLYARTLLWQARQLESDSWFAGLPRRASDGAWSLVGHDGTEHRLADTDEVRLWHPIREPLEEIRAWRAHFEDSGVRQPFKQAFREIYLLTPAEETTDTYSNRFAAHILRYPQAGALIRTRGWNGQHLGYWDGGYEATATKEVGEDGWRAAFDYSLVEQDADGYVSVSLCATDQVRFERRVDGFWTPQHLRDVPALVFSEAMRDVDLFVGVTSIAADPTWNDRGTANQQAYWHQTSFGELTESAQVRREALERLLPRTTLADKVTLEKNFLRVRGHLRSYRIHLGSTNILMSPADTYLCIVPARNSSDPKVFLPFEEGGGKLSVILSKAFLLADDSSITDPSITHQLRRGL